MTLAPPDYLILALAAGGAVTGLFIGFSGALAFLAGTIVSSLVARMGWAVSASYVESTLGRGFAVSLAALVAFWVARALVRRTVRLALAQPGDSIFGVIAAAASGLAVGLGVVWLAQFLGIPGAEGSLLLEKVVAYVG